MDANGAVHFSVLDIMKNLGIEDTPRNREDVAKDLKAMLQTITPHTELLERGGRCPHCKGKVLMRKQGQIHCTECGAAFPESELLPP
jgi:DNA-directed RNA polymerase subunit RPC12/RpoP